MPAKRCILIVLALLGGLTAIGCRSYVVPSPAMTRPPLSASANLARRRTPLAIPDRPIQSPLQLPALQLPPTTDNPWKPNVAERDWKYIVLHHTATSRGSVESIHRTHLSRGNSWLGIGYHFVIGNGNGMPDGEIEATFRWRQQLHGAHAGVGDYNQQGIGIVLVGNFDDRPPTAAQLTAIKRLVATLKAEYGIVAEKVVGHSDVKATACPGRFFPLANVRLSFRDADRRSGQLAWKREP